VAQKWLTLSTHVVWNYCTDSSPSCYASSSRRRCWWDSCMTLLTANIPRVVWDPAAAWWCDWTSASNHRQLLKAVEKRRSVSAVLRAIFTTNIWESIQNTNATVC